MNGNEKKYGQNGQRQEQQRPQQGQRQEQGSYKKEGRQEQNRPQQGQRREEESRGSSKYNGREENE